MVFFQGDGALEADAGLVQLLLVALNHAPIIGSLMEFGGTLDGQRDQLFCRRVIAGLMCNCAQQVQRHGIIFILGQNLTVTGFGLLQAASAVVLLRLIDNLLQFLWCWLDHGDAKLSTFI